MDSGISPPITELRKTPLNALHRRMGARMVNFGGWDMPVEYPTTGGLMTEHKAVRTSVGVFDVSHMGDIRIRAGKTSRGGDGCSQRGELQRVRNRDIRTTEKHHPMSLSPPKRLLRRQIIPIGEQF